MRQLVAGMLFVGCLPFAGIAQEVEASRVTETRWAVKFTPTQMIVGELNLGVEFRTSNKTSLEISFGPTMSEVGLSNFSPKTKWGDQNNTTTSIQDELIRESDIGYFGALGFRFYPLPGPSSMKGLYVSPEFKYRVFNSLISEETGLWDKVRSERVEYKFNFNVGYELWASKAFGFDFFLGGGMGYYQYSEYTPFQTTGSTGITFDWEVDDVRKPQLTVVGGIKVAIGG